MKALQRWLGRAPARPPVLTVLFVCMGNICRSPTAHGVFRQRLREAGLEGLVQVASAGTHGYHAGEPPDPRARRHAALRGIDLSDLRARALSDEDLVRADLVLLMDEQNLAHVRERCPPELQGRLHRLADFCREPGAPGAVPDPYYGGPDGFERVLDIVEDGCAGLLDHVRERLAAAPR